MNQKKTPPGRGGLVIIDRSGKPHRIGGGTTKEPTQKAKTESKAKTAAPRTEWPGKRTDRPKKGREEKKPARRREEKGQRTRKRGMKSERIAGAPGQKFKATVDKNRRGFGFLIFEKRDIPDQFIPPREAESLFHGDRVEVTLSGDGGIRSIEVLRHRFRELVGRYMPHPTGAPSRGGWVVYERKRAREEVFLPKGGKGAKSGDWVRAKLEFHEDGPFRVTGEVTQTFGPDLPASADIGMISAEYDLIEEHSDAAEAEARTYQLDLNDPHRMDLRRVPFITIDGETARDFDDAIYVEKKGSRFILWVAIADVSHYVRPGTALDQEALSRGTSVYFPERAFHMLPRALSENLCSLRPNEPRLALVARMAINEKGKCQETRIIEAIIESKRRATYNEIQAEWETNRNNPDWEYLPHFELYQILKRMRTKRGSLDFDLPEADVRVTDDGEVTSITKRERFDAHRLIEEFMIAANEGVTEWAMKRSWPFIYRVHDEPAEASLNRFQELAASVGMVVSLSGDSLPNVLTDLINRLEGHPAQALLNMALLRAMKQAVYSAAHGGHFGLASEAYTHFTSPIRRYPDLVVHRLLRQILQVEQRRIDRPTDHELQQLSRDLDEKAEHCSYRERLAADAERESIKLKQVRLMHHHLGDEFEAKVVGMADAGIFTEINEPYVEGLVSGESMTDDFYEFNEERMVFYGKKTRRTFQIGDRVQIRVLRADLDRRQIDFGLAEHSADGDTARPGRGSPRKSGRSERDRSFLPDKKLRKDKKRERGGRKH